MKSKSLPHRLALVGLIGFGGFSSSVWAQNGAENTSLPITQDTLATVPAPNPALPAEKISQVDATLNKMEIKGKKRTPLRKRDKTALKIPVSVGETPRSISVMDAERLKEQNITSLAKTFNYTPGIFVNSYEIGGYHYYARGFRMAAADTRQDGFMGISAGGDFSPNLFGIEKTVVLRGPAGILYGTSGAPGGIINLISKQPEAEDKSTLSLKFGPYGGSKVGSGQQMGYGLEYDVTGATDSTERVLYRFLVSQEKPRHFTANINDDLFYTSGALTFKLDEHGHGTITPRFEIYDYTRDYGRAMRISPNSSLKTNDGKSEINFGDFSHSDVNLFDGQRTDKGIVLGLDGSLAFLNDFRLNGAYRYRTYDTDINQFSPVASTLKQTNSADPRSWTVQRAQTTSLLYRIYNAFDVNMIHEFSTQDQSFKNLFQVGASVNISDQTRSASATGPNQSAINIYNGLVNSALKDSTLLLKDAFTAKTTDINYYAQEKVALFNNKLHANIGLGYMTQQVLRDYSLTSTLKSSVNNIDAIEELKTGDFTPNAGLLWQIIPSIATYASYSTSYNFAAGDAQTQSGETGTFKPQTGINYEGGFKVDALSGKISVTTAVYYAEQNNFLSQSDATDLNKNGVRYFTQMEQAGRASTGLEFSGDFLPIPQWKTSLTGAYTNSWNQGGANGIISGSIAERTPVWSSSLYTRYDLKSGFLSGLGSSIGAIYQSSRLSASRTYAAPDPLIYPEFIRLDGGLFYKVNQNLDLAMNVENLLDNQEIVVGGSTGASIEMAAPRMVSVKVNGKW
jgi:iron complex outermembrane receptor protein